MNQGLVERKEEQKAFRVCTGNQFKGMIVQGGSKNIFFFLSPVPTFQLDVSVVFMVIPQV